jgi:hypothetical protein
VLYQVDVTTAKHRIDTISGLQYLQILKIDIDVILIYLFDNENPVVQDSIPDTPSMWLGYLPVDCCNVAMLLMKSCSALCRVSLQLIGDGGKASNACCFLRSLKGLSGEDGRI